jgi:predicted acylesterase/phospholipase RssA
MTTESQTSAHGLRNDIRPRGRKYITVLALDGGGIRGVIPARVVEALERRTGMPTCSLFDLIAGTSTGGIIALGLTKPEKGSKPRYSATDLVDLYRTEGPRIFQRDLAHTLLTLGGLAGPKYPGSTIESVLKSYFGETHITEALTSVLVTSYDTAAATPYFFKSYRQTSSSAFDGAQNDDDYLMWQAARSTSAAPTYFPPFRLKPIDTSAADKSLLDGGVFANSPAMCALADAYKIFRGTDLPYLVVSIGTGNDDLRLVYQDVKWRGLLRWAIPILKIVFDGVSDTVDYQAAEMADEYYRFQEEAIGVQLDDASPETIQRLLADADDLISRNDTTLTALAKVLKENVSPIGVREDAGKLLGTTSRSSHPA